MRKIAIIGGGAAGFFAAIAAAETDPKAEVVIWERSNSVLQKVRVSGGGRCNVTHACFSPRELAAHYPRGQKELLGPFHSFGPIQTVEWFAKRGVPLKTETDGRMFPTTDSSETIVQCLQQAAAKAGVKVHTSARIAAFARQGDQWLISSSAGALACDALIITTGSSEAIWQELAKIGLPIVAPVPSLFTFNIKSPILDGLMGVSVPNAAIQWPGMRWQNAGPLLITHWGLSGPAVLKLSAWGARDMHACQYQFPIAVNWLGAATPEQVMQAFADARVQHSKKTLWAAPFFGLPIRLWQRLVLHAGIPETIRWADIDKKRLQSLQTLLIACPFRVNGKSTFKEEFVTAGGVDLKEINFKTFECKRFPGLYLAGEVLNIDAITGGFNFQAAWTGGWHAGINAASQ